MKRLEKVEDDVFLSIIMSTHNDIDKQWMFTNKDYLYYHLEPVDYPENFFSIFPAGEIYFIYDILGITKFRHIYRNSSKLLCLGDTNCVSGFTHKKFPLRYTRLDNVIQFEYDF